jgi:hypothetical protein
VKHRLFNLVAAASLILWLVAIRATVSSLYPNSWEECNGPTPIGWRLFVSYGAIGVRHWPGITVPTGSLTAPTSVHGRHWPYANGVWFYGTGNRQLAYFGSSYALRGAMSVYFYEWSLGYMLLLFSTSPLVAFFLISGFRSYRRRHAPRVGVCHACGYDLCATPERCPECGTVPKASANPKPEKV